ncbi:MAG: lysophospholipid acyltransferase family protein [Methylovirgula sp.]
MSLRYRIEDLAFAAAGASLSLLPLETASAVSGRLWKLLGPQLGNRRHKRALENLALAFPEKSEADHAALAAAMWENLGCTFAETFRLREIAASDRLTVEVPDGFAHPTSARVVCAPHQGNWEIAVLAVSADKAAQPAGVYQRIKNPLVDARVAKMRSFLYPGGLYPKTPSTPRQLIRHAREGGTLAILADQRDMRGPRVAFFGHLAPSTPFPAMVARTLGLKLYAGEIIREPHVRFAIKLVEIPMPQTEDRDVDITIATARLQAVFEASIRRHPEQWMWSHRRWG